MRKFEPKNHLTTKTMQRKKNRKISSQKNSYNNIQKTTLRKKQIAKIRAKKAPNKIP